MATLGSISRDDHEFLKLPSTKWFQEATNHSGMAKGGIYLLSGPPGVGKTTIALQMAIDIAAGPYKVLYISMELAPAAVKSYADRVFDYRKSLQAVDFEKSNDWKKGLKNVHKVVASEKETHSDENLALKNLEVDASVNSMENLPDFLTRQVLGANAQYHGVKIIIVDSIQGLGTAATSSKPYQELYKFNRWCKDSGITVVLIGHVTKGGSIAGPRSLEHNVDCVIYLRKAMKLRPLFVPKNRFGPERFEPLALLANKYGCLEKSPHMEAAASRAYGFLPNIPKPIEVQALVKLPKFGGKPGVLAPYLPKQKLQQLIGVVSRIKDVDLSDLTFEINCSIPGGGQYHFMLDFPLIVSILSSYFQKSILSNSLFVGEVDLHQTILPLPDSLSISDFVEWIKRGSSKIDNIFIAQTNSEILEKEIKTQGLHCKVHGIENLQSVIRLLWPDIFE